MSSLFAGNKFAINKEERWPCVCFMVYIVYLHALMLGKFFALMSCPTAETWLRFMRNYRMSGFDPISYSVLIRWHMGYDILRHPLLAFMMWPLSQCNQLLRAMTGTDCAMPLMALLLAACAFGSFLLMWRTLRRVVCVPCAVATLLTLFFMSFAYIMLTAVVADHFCLSLFMLMLVLYRAGVHLRDRTAFGIAEAVALFVVTAGITLSNGLAVLLALLAVNGRAALRPRFLCGALVLPPVLMLALAVGLAAGARHDSGMSQTADTTQATGTAQIVGAAPAAVAVDQQFKWTCHDLSRTDVVAENMFGESLQLHRKHVLGDVLSGRPVIVRYSWGVQYAVEILVVLLFAAGAWAGRRQRFEWLLMAVFAMNVALHVVLAFALNEIHIMTAHWAFVIPLSVGWLFCRRVCMLPRPVRAAVFAVIAAITVCLLVYHGVLLWRYLTWPLCK